MSKRILLCVLLFLPYEELHATTIAAIRTAKYVVLGIDSKWTVHDRADRDQGFGCKIISNEGRVVYAPAGLIYSQQEFDLSKIVRSEPFVSNRIEVLVRKISAGLDRVVPSVRSEEPDVFVRWLSGRPILVLMIAWIEHTGVSFAILEFTLASSGASVAGRPVVLMRGGEDFTRIYSFTTADVRSVLPLDWSHKEHAEVIRELIQDDIRVNPAVSGPPISIVRVSSSGIEWLESGSCFNEDETQSVDDLTLR